MKILLSVFAAMALAVSAFGQASVTRNGLIVQQPSLVFTTPVIGVASGTSLTLSSLTTTRVPFATAAGLLTDSAAFTFTVGSGTLAATVFSGAGTGLTGTAASLTAGTATVATTVTAADEAADTTTFPLFVTAATGNLGAKTNASFTFNSNTGALGATSFNATGSATGIVTITGLTSGHLKITGADAMAQDVTISLAAQTSGAATLTIPDQAGVSKNLLTAAGTIAITSGKTVTFDHTSTFTTTDSAVYTFPAATKTLLATDGSGASLTALTAANISTGALADGMTATTQSPATNTTRIASGAYADASSAAAALAGMVSTYATPDTTGGAVTLTKAVTEVWTNTTTTYTIPAVASSTGKAIIFYVVGTNAITVDPNASEIVVKDGTPLSGGTALTLTGAAGNYVCLVCDGTRWCTLGFKGTLGP